jgi:hypothetical protein
MKKRYLLLTIACFIYSTALFALDADLALKVDIIIDTHEQRIPKNDVATIKSLGPEVVEHLLGRYEQSEDSEKAKLASLLWHLGWQNEEAAEVLLADIHTEDQALRVTVQYALGHISTNPTVVSALLDNMRNDDNAFFRDKAACALAYDQPNLNQHQKYFLYRGLIDGLSDEKYQVRNISIKALKIQTGQRFGFSAKADQSQRSTSIDQWKSWLDEYQQSL